MKLLVVSSSLFTDRMLLFSTFANSILSEAKVDVWSTSYPENSQLWEEKGYRVLSFPHQKNFRESLNLLRFINHHLWNYKLNATSILSMQKFAELQTPLKYRTKRKLERYVGRVLALFGFGVGAEKLLLKLLLSQNRSLEARKRMIEEKYDGIFITNPFWQHESAVGIEASKLGIPIYSLIPSWDNITTKSRLVFKSNAFAVWSDIRIKEFREYYPIFHDVPVYPVGAAQYDVFFNDEMLEEKRAFCEKNQLKMDLPILLYCIGSPNFVKSEITTCIDSLKYFGKKGLLESIQVLIRPHPNKHNSENEAEYLAIHDNVKIQNVGLQGRITEKRFQTKSQIIDWVSTFKHVDLVVNLSSTVTLDSTFFNKPVINIDFDNHGTKTYHSFIKFLNRNWTHLKSLYNSDAIDYVDSNEFFYKTILRVMESPEYRSEERKALRKLICNNEDGKSGEKLALSVLETFKSFQR